MIKKLHLLEISMIEPTSTPSKTCRGIILFAHGSRDPHWRTPIEAVATKIRADQPEVLLRCAYLEICEPTLMQACSELIAEGAKRLRIFPLFLGVGKHAREDLPLLIEEVRYAHPGVHFELLKAAGEFERMTALMADIAMS